jgi:hypothetical protein
MTNMVGMGPFITIPIIIAAMGGPQCMLGWFAGSHHSTFISHHARPLWVRSSS